MVDIPIDKAMNWVGGVDSPYAAGNLIGQGGIPSIMRSTSGVITQLRQEHTWVEAYVDFEPSQDIAFHPDVGIVEGEYIFRIATGLIAAGNMLALNDETAWGVAARPFATVLTSIAIGTFVLPYTYALFSQ